MYQLLAQKEVQVREERISESVQMRDREFYLQLYQAHRYRINYILGHHILQSLLNHQPVSVLVRVVVARVQKRLIRAVVHQACQKLGLNPRSEKIAQPRCLRLG